MRGESVRSDKPNDALYSFTGLNSSQSQTLTDKYHIYLTSNGRISMAGLNTKNVRYVAECIDKVVRGEAKL